MLHFLHTDKGRDSTVCGNRGTVWVHEAVEFKTVKFSLQVLYK